MDQIQDMNKILSDPVGKEKVNSILEALVIAVQKLKETVNEELNGKNGCFNPANMLCYLNKILSKQVNAELGRAQSGLGFKKLCLNNALLGPTDKNATTSNLRVLSSICLAFQGWGQA